MITVRYAAHRSQVADLYLPSGSAARPCPVVVLVHGGFWLARYDRSLMAPLARDVAARGFAAWNVEYRRVGQRGGGWPGTFQDVAAAVDLLDDIARDQRLDLSRVASIGHSSGGHLALWLAARPGLPRWAPGAEPRVRLTTAVAQAGITDLIAGDEAWLGGGACSRLLGGSPSEVTERYALASPIERVPLGIPQLLVHGAADRHVPIDQSRSYADTARLAGDAVELLAFPGMGHFEVLDPSHASWHAVTDRLPHLLNYAG